MIFHLSLVRSLAAARVRLVRGGQEETSHFDAELPAYRLWQANVFPLLMSVLSVGVVTAVLFVLNQAIAATLVPIAYLIPVIIAATRWGIWPATLASVVAMAAADFFFFTPLYSFRVDNPQEAIDLLLFLFVALVCSNLASRLRRETETLRQREKEIHYLYEFSRRLAACFTVPDLISAIQHYLSRALGQQAAFFVAMSDGHFEPPESRSAPEAIQESAASMISGIGVIARTIVDQPTQDVWLLRAVSSETRVHGVIAINIGRSSPQTIESRARRIEVILEESSLTLQRLDIGKAMDNARLHLQAQLLRDAFHGTLSHELCSPLAAIQGSASVLDSMPRIQEDPRSSALVEAISDEAAQLDGFIQNLLNATRVTAGGVNPRMEWADPKDIVNAALGRRKRRLAAHRIEVEFDDDLPLLRVDSGLIEESCGQLLENAAKYSPSGSTISVRVRAEHEHVILSISDQGVGITPQEQRHLGRRSFRSERHQATISGSGLGFWIASTFVQANGGAIVIASRGQGLGTTVSISFPASQMTTSELAAFANE
ncbi:two-component system, OmpR family, sensor histidine kinase KdpD [Bradyrhizobium canariense]|uniref:histidine kinase n=1 Tax=Bradyrhizobium canariense TaxID=255045 RepID=A0A1H1QTV0_9BRAD|nr:two-component system, OmpR family, sensor histidine kinase KdpD [Bradyrhizobium canariense]